MFNVQGKEMVDRKYDLEERMVDNTLNGDV
jgi:hypothetical protein